MVRQIRFCKTEILMTQLCYIICAVLGFQINPCHDCCTVKVLCAVVFHSRAICSTRQTNLLNVDDFVIFVFVCKIIDVLISKRLRNPIKQCIIIKSIVRPGTRYNWTKGYPQTAQKCLSGNLDGGAFAVAQVGSPSSTSCCFKRGIINISDGT